MARPKPPTDTRICIGMITAPHGVKGLLRIRPFTADPAQMLAYGMPVNDHGRRLVISLRSVDKGEWLAAVEGVDDRTAADALRGSRLWVERAALPDDGDEDSFYHADLIGLDVVDPAGTKLGRVLAVPDFGAGDLLEVQPPEGPSLLLPFTRAVVPVVDLAARRIVAIVPDGLRPGASDADDAAQEGGEDG